MADHGRMRKRERERAQVGDRERIDDGRAVVERELHHHQPWRIGSFGVELGVERDAFRSGDARAEPFQLAGHR